MSFKYVCSTEKYAFKLPVSAPSACSICVFVSPNAPFTVIESALATLLKNGTYSNNELASAIGIWCHVKSNGVTSIHDGLVARRISEINVFLYGDYSGEATGFYSVRFEQTEKGDRARDIAFYEAGSAYDPAFEATSDDGEIFLGWYTEDGTLLTDLRATQDLTVTARWQSDDAWV